MKNLYTIEKPTLEIFGVAPYGKSETQYQIECFLASRNVYITSEENPKLDEWGFNVKNNVIFKSKGFTADEYDKKYCKKIILTTDPKLIADGIQDIDVNFLQWFLKNLTCEYVNVIPLHDDSGFFCYKIIIPTEDEWLSPMQKFKLREKEQVKCYDKFNQLLKEGDYVDVQKDGVHQIYKKDDGQLYFKPYGEEDRVSAYFSNDIAKCDANGNWLNNDRYEDIPETLEEAFDRISKTIDYSEFDFASFKIGVEYRTIKK
jgi:hypothetical protein